MVIDKGSRTFLIECIIFQDHTFEIAINDITQQEQESRLKRQLTQNIAHELKTPVSSIRGYMETILSTEMDDSRKNVYGALLRTIQTIDRFTKRYFNAQ